MYSKPEVTRFGSFRELTLVGTCGASDILSVAGTCQATLVDDNVQPRLS